MSIHHGEWCQCEHAAHFPDTGLKTPNGNPGHRYGQAFTSRSLHHIKTPYGTFHICGDCATDCYEQFLTPEQKAQIKPVTISK